MQCDMCGKEDELFKTKIEETIMNLCKSCSKYGKIIERIKTNEEIKEDKKKEKQEIKNIIEKKTTSVQSITEGYGKLIKEARERLKLKQEDFAKKINEKTSLIHHIEIEKTEPSIKLARKLEKFLNIRLIDEFEEEKLNIREEKSDEFTLGDFIKVKKRN